MLLAPYVLFLQLIPLIKFSGKVSKSHEKNKNKHKLSILATEHE